MPLPLVRVVRVFKVPLHNRVDPMRYLKRVKEEVTLHNYVSDIDNVVSLQETYENDDTAFVVLEMCDGGDLEEYTKVQLPLLGVPGASECHTRSIL